MPPQTAAPNLYHYQPLSDAQGSIRILTLMPAAKFSAPLHGTLCESRFVNEDWPDASYEALSYVWGPTNSGHYIICDELRAGRCGRIPITENCDLALRYLRFRQQPRRLWVDAICINQQDISERNLQVRVMATIYSCAQQTIAWLGQESPPSRMAFRVISFVAFLDKHKALGGFLLPLSHMFMQYYAGKASLLPLEIFADMYHRPWFSRMWTLQELYFSKNVVVRIGALTISWEKHYSAAFTLGMICCRKAIFGGLDSPQSGRLLPATKVVQDLRDQRSDLLLTDAWKLLLECRQQGASELRDKIFALYWILKDAWADSNTSLPDYNQSIPDIFKRATILALQPGKVGGNIFLGVCNCNERIHGLPSWCPDYSHNHPIPRGTVSFSNLYEHSLSDTERVLHLSVTHVTSVMATAHWPPQVTDPSNETWLGIILHELQGVVNQRKGWLDISCPRSNSAQNLWIVDLARRSRLFKDWFDTTAESMGDETLLGKLLALLRLQFDATGFFCQAWSYIFLGKPLPRGFRNKIYQVDLSQACILWETETETMLSLARLCKLAALGATNPKFLAFEMACEIHKAVLSLFSDFTVLVLRSRTLALGYQGVQFDDRIGFAPVPIIFRPEGDHFRMISPVFMAYHDTCNMFRSIEAGQELMFL